MSRTPLLPALAAVMLALPVFGGTARAGEFTLESPDLAPGATVKAQQVFKGFGCSGGNVSPALLWKHPPAGTRSFAVTLCDPDAPTGSGWWHWLVVNLPASTSGLPAGAGDAKGALLPSRAVQGRTDFGTPGYGGPCPPVGDKPHRYVFTVYALKVDKLDLPADAGGAMIGYQLNANALGKATLTGYYGR